MSFAVTPQHEAIFAWVADPAPAQPALIIDAVAGSGKSSTLIEILRRLPATSSAAFLAFNKSAATEIEEKAKRAGLDNSNVQFRTLNAFGFRALTTSNRRVNVDSGIVRRRLARHVGAWEEKTFASMVAKLVGAAKSQGLIPRAAKLPKKGLVDDSDQTWRSLMTQFQIDPPGDDWGLVDKAIGLARTVLAEGLRDLNTIDFDDQIYLPWALDIPLPRVDWLLVDECFPAGTMIETEQGPLPIERIVDEKLDVRVVSCDSAGVLRPSQVQAAYRTPVVEPLITIEHENGTITTTRNHPFWVVGRGWVAAGLLESGDALCCLRQADGAAGDVVLDVLRAKAQQHEAGSSSRGGEASEDLDPDGRRQDRDSEPNAQPGSGQEGLGDASCDRAQAVGPWWQWHGSDGMRGPVAVGPAARRPNSTMGARLCHRVWGEPAEASASTKWSADMLQAGHCGPQPEDCDRGGRVITPTARAEGTGRTQDSVLAVSRVVRVSGQECRREAGCGCGCRTDSHVYTLSVEAGSYIADGLLVKNCQDLAPTQRAMLASSIRGGGRLIAVGDPHQAIYGWRGADCDSLGAIGRDYNATTLPLSTTYRCPQTVTEMARQFVPHFECPASSPVGTITSIDTTEDGKKFDAIEWRTDDLVVCRNNAPLVTLAYKLMRRRVPVRVAGRAIGTAIHALIRKLRPTSPQDLVTKIAKHQDAMIAKARARDPDDDEKVQKIVDECETALVFAQESETLADLDHMLSTMFADDGTGQVTLSSVHRAKGAEAPRVFILDYWRMPSRMARTAEAKLQEKNLQYVAVTRARSELVFLTISTKKPDRSTQQPSLFGAAAQ
jgi:superfamily I DNA/RNA helicase